MTGQMKKRRIGPKMKNKNITIAELFNRQIENQMLLIENGKYDDFVNQRPIVLPEDNSRLSSYHVQQLISEIGEVLEADKRWKNCRNDKCDLEHKAEEIADCFIVLMNIAMYSNINSDELSEVIKKKLDVVHRRFEDEVATVPSDGYGMI